MSKVRSSALLIVCPGFHIASFSSVQVSSLWFSGFRSKTSSGSVFGWESFDGDLVRIAASSSWVFSVRHRAYVSIILRVSSFVDALPHGSPFTVTSGDSELRCALTEQWRKGSLMFASFQRSWDSEAGVLTCSDLSSSETGSPLSIMQNYPPRLERGCVWGLHGVKVTPSELTLTERKLSSTTQWFLTLRTDDAWLSVRSIAKRFREFEGSADPTGWPDFLLMQAFQ